MQTPRKFILALIGSLAMFSAHAASNHVTDSLLRHLDLVIANRQQYLHQKQCRIDSLQRVCDTQQNDDGRFNALIPLFDEYQPFNADSAYNIGLRLKKLADLTGNDELKVHAKLKLADILSSTAMYTEALGIIKTIESSSLPQYLLPYYFHINRTLYGRLEDYSAFQPEKERYHRLTDVYRDSILAINDPNSLSHVITLADRHNTNGSPDKAIGIIKAFMDSNKLSEHDLAICSYTLAYAYSRTGNREAFKQHLLISSIADLKSCVREYISVRELALLLYEEGDLERAYRLIKIAVEDAAQCNARQRIIELNESYPKINDIYVKTISQSNKALRITVIGIVILALVLIVLLIMMREQVRRVALARKEAEQAYSNLNILTGQLRESNQKLTQANGDIAEISRLKEVYIGRYMDQCLNYIETLENYRKNVAKLVKAGRTDDLRKLIKNTPDVDKETKEFYAQFDQTFLSLFPTFVADINSLLQPGEELTVKKDGSLSAELRIYALIRLGITDSDKIAKFLRYSLTTIYNYRTKVRNKAKGDRNEFESKVVLIGRNNDQ